MELKNNMPKNRTNKFKIICFFARECGVEALKGILNDKRFVIVRLLVHSKQPKSQDPNRGIRPEFPVFKKIAAKHAIPLSVVDTREEAQKLSSLRTIDSCDFLISLSWRFLIPKDILSKAKIAAINVHRGKLPDYAGAEPIKKALEKGEKHIVVTVHEMVEEIDAGKVLVEKNHPVNYDDSKSLAENVTRLQKEILPLYHRAIIETIENITDKGGYAKKNNGPAVVIERKTKRL
jgi:methionyl-tRNA formyltransferase